MIPIKELTVIAKAYNKFPVDFDSAWQWVGYARKDVALDLLKANFETGIDFSATNRKSTGGRPSHGYFLTVDCFKAFCMIAGTDKGKEVRKYYLSLEKQYFRKDIDRKSKDNRNAFTDGCKRQGLTKPYEYAAVTRAEYSSLFNNPDIRKDNMNREQILALSALDAVEAYKYSRLPQDTLRLPGITKSVENTALLLENAAESQLKQIGLSA